MLFCSWGAGKSVPWLFIKREKRMKKIIAGLFMVSLLLGGCAANVKRDMDLPSIPITRESAGFIVFSIDGSKIATESSDWGTFKGAWHDALKDAAAEKYIKISEQKGDGKPSTKAGTKISIYVKDYRYVSAGARLVAGILTGNAFINARVKFSDLKDGRVLGERSYDTSSSAWQGIFAAMTRKQLGAISWEIIEEIARARDADMDEETNVDTSTEMDGGTERQ
jgi:hypothetical protein